MDWLMVADQLFDAVLPIVLTALTSVVIAFVTKATKEAQAKTKNELADKYLDKLNIIISNAVLATTQTYVAELKDQNAFDKEAQKNAFNKTYEAVTKMLTDEAKSCLAGTVGDLETYISTQIEAMVRLQK
jgi:hypothetical protein